MEKKYLIELDSLVNLPQKPGVYLMKDDKKKIIYVGKSVNLKKRIDSYATGREDTRAQIPFLLEKVTSIETIITFTEKEALILENTLIKKHKPKYNILLKDDKSYLCIAIQKSSKYPRIELKRYPLKNDKDYLCSKPYTNSLTAKSHYEIIRRTFLLRSCTDNEFRSRTRPCILYDINKCSAPCVKQCTKKLYDESVKGAKHFLKGNIDDTTSHLKQQIAKSSKLLLYEKAGHYYKMLTSLENTNSEPLTISDSKDLDVIAIIQQSGFAVIYKLVFRKKLLVDGQHYCFSSVASSTNSTLSAFIMQHYERLKNIPSLIYTQEQLPDEKNLSKILGLKISSPKIGKKHKYIRLALENTKDIFDKEYFSPESTSSQLNELKKILKLKNFPIVIECIDTSCLSGRDSVASVVVYKNGVPIKSLYRNYHIDSKSFSDDISAMKEVITRRYKKHKKLP